MSDDFKYLCKDLAIPVALYGILIIAAILCMRSNSDYDRLEKQIAEMQVEIEENRKQAKMDNVYLMVHESQVRSEIWTALCVRENQWGKK